ncbi:MAG TPA: GNAT family N-acetyltransferase [Bacillus sp. (in: firmicutes)]|nr:GNAT family N-acetyltransferase [Bacillus sp. (in: firmicutes)]
MILAGEKVVENQEAGGSKFTVVRAAVEHVPGIINVCVDGWHSTYGAIRSPEYIERVTRNYYAYDRIYQEVMNGDKNPYIWYVALENNRVVGAIAGGEIEYDKGEIFTLYADYQRRGEGIGTLLLDHLTKIQSEKGLKKQWVSVAKGNEKAIPFYEAKSFVRMSEQISRFSNEQERYMSYRYMRSI